MLFNSIGRRKNGMLWSSTKYIHFSIGKLSLAYAVLLSLHFAKSMRWIKNNIGETQEWFWKWKCFSSDLFWESFIKCLFNRISEISKIRIEKYYLLARNENVYTVLWQATDSPHTSHIFTSVVNILQYLRKFKLWILKCLIRLNIFHSSRLHSSTWHIKWWMLAS